MSVKPSLTLKASRRSSAETKAFFLPCFPLRGQAIVFLAVQCQRIIQMDLPLSETRCACILEEIITCCLGFTVALFCLDSAESCRELVRSES